MMGSLFFQVAGGGRGSNNSPQWARGGDQCQHVEWYPKTRIWQLWKCNACRSGKPSRHQNGGEGTLIYLEPIPWTWDVFSLPFVEQRLGLMPSSNNLADYTATTDLKTIRAVGSCDFPHVIRFYAGLIDKVWQSVAFVASSSFPPS